MRRSGARRLPPSALVLLFIALTGQTAPLPAPDEGETSGGCACRRSDTTPTPYAEPAPAEAPPPPPPAEPAGPAAPVARSEPVREITRPEPERPRQEPRPEPRPAPVREVKPIDPPRTAPAQTASARASAEQHRWVIAVMDIEAAKDKVLTVAMLRSLADQTRVFLGVRGMKTITKGSMEAAIQQMVQEEKKRSYAACVDAACQIPLGKALAASHILRLGIARFDTTCTMNAELIDLRSEVTVTAATTRADCKTERLLDASERLADQIIRESAER